MTHQLIESVRDVVCVIGGIGLFVWLIFAIVNGINQSDQNDCLKWQNEASQYVGYYITEWQERQCDYYGVEINAPVVRPNNASL